MGKGDFAAFSSIQWHFIRDVHAKFSNRSFYNSHQSPDIGQKSVGGISDFGISGQCLIKGNYHNSRTSDNIDMKFGPVTKLDKGNKKESRCIVCKIYIFIIGNLLSYKNWKQN